MPFACSMDPFTKPLIIMDHQKKTYEAPAMQEFGTVASLTAAIGSSSDTDQSDFPQQFPPDGGSFDVCDNNDERTVC